MECKREEHFMAFNTVSIYLTIIWITHCVFMEITPYFITVCSISYSRWFVIVQNLQNFISNIFMQVQIISNLSKNTYISICNWVKLFLGLTFRLLRYPLVWTTNKSLSVASVALTVVSSRIIPASMYTYTKW